ncbi:MAG: helix-turn-helix domain-containing protein [Bdellovibrionaceae bacterium]|nr:helix-turn-helix domain-containing protein [Pseudobdellovibrionaceae bacterium]
MPEKKKPRRKRQDQSVFAKNLNRLLADRGISHRVAAQMIGVSQSTFASWSAGSAPSDLAKVAALAKALGVSFSYLCLGIEDHPNRNEVDLSDLYTEEPVSFDGLFKIKATRLVRKKTK